MCFTQATALGIALFRKKWVQPHRFWPIVGCILHALLFHCSPSSLAAMLYCSRHIHIFKNPTDVNSLEISQIKTNVNNFQISAMFQLVDVFLGESQVVG